MSVPVIVTKIAVDLNTSRMGSAKMISETSTFQTDFIAHGGKVILQRTASVVFGRTNVSWYVKIEGATCFIGTFSTAESAIGFYGANTDEQEDTAQQCHALLNASMLVAGYY